MRTGDIVGDDDRLLLGGGGHQQSLPTERAGYIFLQFDFDKSDSPNPFDVFCQTSTFSDFIHVNLSQANLQAHRAATFLCQLHRFR